MTRGWLVGVLSALSVVGLSTGAHAGPIISATGGVINSGAPGFGTLTETLDQTGLFTGYTSGVTDFDTYLAGNPIHSLIFAGNEWFSNSGTSSASVTYDLGAALLIDALALWNEDSSGIGTLNLLSSLDGVTFAPLLSNLSPTNNPINFDYGADVFSFAALTAQFVRFDMSNCPQPDVNAFNACAIGEVAFRTVRQVTQVPEPSTIAMFSLGLFGLMFLGRRRRSAGGIRAA